MKKEVGFLLKVIEEVNKSNNLENLCDEVSEFVHYVMSNNGYDCHVCIGEFKNHPNGEYHLWNEVSGVRLDLTVSQFGNYQNGVIDNGFYDDNYEQFDMEILEINEERLLKNRFIYKYLEINQ